MKVLKNEIKHINQRKFSNILWNWNYIYPYSILLILYAFYLIMVYLIKSMFSSVTN